MEPTYVYRKGEGWVVDTLDGGRVFTFKGKQWIIKEIFDRCSVSDITWRTSEKILEMSTSELQDYGDMNWGSPYPGIKDGARSPIGTARLYLFTELK